MDKKKIFLVIAVFSIMAAYSCHKASVEFKESFSCKIDGVDWTPDTGTDKPGGITGQSIAVSTGFVTKTHDIYAEKKLNAGTVKIIFQQFFLVFNSKANDKRILSRAGGDYFHDSQDVCDYFYPDSTSNSFIYVTSLDTISKIAKGTFQFNATSPTCGKKIIVTEGKFEVKIF